MLEDFAPKLAHLMTAYSQPVEPGNFTRIQATSPLGEPLVLALVEAVIKRGGYPHIQIALPEVAEIFFEFANEDQLKWLDPLAKLGLETFDRSFTVLAPRNSNYLSSSDPAKMGVWRETRQPLNAIWAQRHGDKSYRWSGTLWPTPAAAQEAGMGDRAFRAFVYQACGLAEDDPVAYWQAFRDRQEQFVTWLAGKKQVTVKGPGIDMSFSMAGRTWINAHGDYNMPDGEIFTGPVEDSVNGRVAFNMPSQYFGVSYKGVVLTFKDGVVVEATAEQGEEQFLALLDTDEGSRRLGEFAIGTNPFIQQYMGNTLYDEKIGGTIHMAIGLSIPGCGGENHSSVHFDMVHDMRQGGEVWVDGTLFYRAGEFQV